MKNLHLVYGAVLGAAGLYVFVRAGLPVAWPYLFLSGVTIYAVVRYHLRLPGDLSYSLATPVIMGGAVACHEAGGVWLAVLDALLRAVARRRPPWWRLSFTLGQAAVCAAVGNWVLLRMPPGGRDYLWGAVATAAFLVCNVLLFWGMVSLQPDPTLRAAFRRTMRMAVEMQLLEAVAGGLLVGLLRSGDPGGVFLMIVILVMFGLTVRRLSDAQFQSRSDPLTRLWNLRGFADDFQAALDRFFGARRSFGLVVLDLDRFKDVNDTYGHDVGNEVLRHVADRLHHHVRQVDGVYRIGGEEFAVIMPDIGRQALRERAEQLEAAIGGEPVHVSGGRTLSVTASVGFALCPEDGEDYESLFRHADQAMYRAKVAHRRARREAEAARAEDVLEL
ncbi:MAG: GGDEF domain-containing protein [Clostridia bacterium]|nr:GGDEF domain-containing protein [Clostridia bacterium]